MTFGQNRKLQEIDKQRKVICDTEKRVEETRSTLRSAARNEPSITAYMLVLKRNTEKIETELSILHLKKSMRLYGDHIIKQEQTNFIILSGQDFDDEVNQVFRLGMSCDLKNRPHPISQELEVEKLFRQVNNAKKKVKVTIENENLFKCELKRFGLRSETSHSEFVISKDQYENIKELKSATDITVRKADKS